MEDEVIWTKAKDGRFSVKSLYKDLDQERREEFPANIIWNSLVPPRVSFFAWEATWKKSVTLDRLQKRGFSLANRCYLCLVEEESIDQILLHCGLARSLWSLLFSLWSFVGAPLFNKRGVIGVVRALCGKGKEESVSFSTLVPLLDCLEGKKQ